MGWCSQVVVGEKLAATGVCLLETIASVGSDGEQATLNSARETFGGTTAWYDFPTRGWEYHPILSGQPTCSYPPSNVMDFAKHTLQVRSQALARCFTV
jgi:hypothetical protein